MARDLDVGYLGVVVDDRDPQAIFDSMAAALATTAASPTRQRMPSLPKG